MLKRVHIIVENDADFCDEQRILCRPNQPPIKKYLNVVVRHSLWRKKSFQAWWSQKVFWEKKSALLYLLFKKTTPWWLNKTVKSLYHKKAPNCSLSLSPSFFASISIFLPYPPKNRKPIRKKCLKIKYQLWDQEKNVVFSTYTNTT